MEQAGVEQEICLGMYGNGREIGTIREDIILLTQTIQLVQIADQVKFCAVVRGSAMVPLSYVVHTATTVIQRSASTALASA